jgi:uncharacterized membrane protein YphA (DoxX/SURF4 family)
VSEELWRPILEYYENNGLKLPAFEHLDNWNQGSAKYAVEAVELLAGRQMFPVPHNRYVAWFTILSTVLFCVLWFLGFYGKLTSPTESFALCLAMALLIGTNVKALTGPMPLVGKI